jgi:hypothetical protein
VWKVGDLVSNANISAEFKALLKVFLLIFYLYLYIHFAGCTWNYFVSLEEEWIPNMDFIWFGVPDVYDYFYGELYRKYLVSLYIGFYLFAVGEVCPRSQTELFAAAVIMLLSLTVNGIIIGNMSLYLYQLNDKSR